MAKPSYVDTVRLKSRLILAGMTAKAFAELQEWKCEATAYRKINGKVPFTVPEILKCRECLKLNDEDLLAIFFPHELS